MKNPLIVPLKILRGHEVSGGLGVMSIAFHPVLVRPWMAQRYANTVATVSRSPQYLRICIQCNDISGRNGPGLTLCNCGVCVNSPGLPRAERTAPSASSRTSTERIEGKNNSPLIERVQPLALRLLMGISLATGSSLSHEHSVIIDSYAVYFFFSIFKNFLSRAIFLHIFLCSKFWMLESHRLRHVTQSRFLHQSRLAAKISQAVRCSKGQQDMSIRIICPCIIFALTLSCFSLTHKRKKYQKPLQIYLRERRNTTQRVDLSISLSWSCRHSNKLRTRAHWSPAASAGLCMRLLSTRVRLVHR